MSRVCAVVLAAGLGKRMKSTTPKVLHTIAGRPLIHYPVRAALDAGAQHAVVVVGHAREAAVAYLRRAFGDRVSFAVQEPQLGTGHAVMQALPQIPADADRVLIVYGDTPLLVADDLKAVCDALDSHPESPLALLVCRLDDPTGYGRLLRNAQGRIVDIREHRDLRSSEERGVREVNPGIYSVRAAFLPGALDRLAPNNSQGELYLTDIVAHAAASGGVVDVTGDGANLVGINDRAQLATAEALMVDRIVRRLRLSGVTIRAGVLVDDTVEVEPDALIGPNVVLRGATRVGAGARIDVGCVLTDCVVEQGAWLKPYSIADESRIGPSTEIGPFARLRPGCDIRDGAHLGNFVEAKKTIMHPRAKANHLAYIGDSEIGEAANIGAGTIFCNYDGFQKHKTTIGKGVFVGSDSQLVAPVVVGDNAYVATGTTVTQDVPADALAIGRARQENKEGYAPRLRAKLVAAKAAKT